MKEIIVKLIEYIASTSEKGLKKWLVGIALACLLASLLAGCATMYKNKITCAHGKDTIQIEYTVQGRLQRR